MDLPIPAVAVAGAPGSGRLLFADPSAKQQPVTDMLQEHERHGLTTLRSAKAIN